MTPGTTSSSRASSRTLGPGYAIRYPRMPDQAAPDPAAWKEAIAREIGELNDGLLLVGHSVGAAVLLDYLADRAQEHRIERRTNRRGGGRLPDRHALHR